MAVTIFAIVATVLYSSFHAGIKILRRSEEVMRYHQDLRLVVDEVSLDLNNCLLAELHDALGKETFISEELSGSEKEPIIFFTGERKSFTFVTLKDTFTEKGIRRGVCNVTYSLKGGESGSFVRSTRYQSTGFVTDEDKEEILLTGVDDIEVTYSYAPEDEEEPPIWLDYWEQEERIPLGVKLKLKLKGLGRLQEFTKTVYIDVGTLGVVEEGIF